jgi:hypothetical protein
MCNVQHGQPNVMTEQASAPAAAPHHLFAGYERVGDLAFVSLRVHKRVHKVALVAPQPWQQRLFAAMSQLLPVQAQCFTQPQPAIDWLHAK